MIINLNDAHVRVREANSSKGIQIGNQEFQAEDLNPSIIKFQEFWDYMEAVKMHGYTRAAMSVIGRAAVGAWWSLRKHEEHGTEAIDLHRKKLFAFYMMEKREWNTIKDYYSLAGKLLIALKYLRYFGRCAFEVVRNRAGEPIGLDFLFGLVIPNVDENGKFKTPAFVQYLTSDPRDKVEFNDPREIIYIIDPDWEGSPWGGSDIEALGEFAMPLDLFLQSAASHYMENRDRPEVIYQVSDDIDDDSYDRFVNMIGERHRGHANVGRNPIVIAGELKVQELSRMPEGLPYQEARNDTREEILAVSGTPGAKLGLSRDLSSANLREMRREFHESTMIPLFRLVELAFYEQIHVRLFNYPDWEFKFKQPDFLTEVERATVDMRYYSMGVYNPNEIRYAKGQPPREDENGDLYYDQLMATLSALRQPQGSPPEGRPTEPDSPSQVGEPNTEPEPPARGDGHDDNTRDDNALIGDLRKWRAFAVKRVKNGRPLRFYQSEHIPCEIGELIQLSLARATSVEQVAEVFDDAIQEVLAWRE